VGRASLVSMSRSRQGRGCGIRVLADEPSGGVWRAGPRLAESGFVGVHVADARIDRVSCHLIGVIGPQQVDGWPGVLLPREPAVVVGGLEDDGHAVVNRCREFVGIGGDDRVTDEPAALRLFPGVPESGKGERLATLEPKA